MAASVSAGNFQSSHRPLGQPMVNGDDKGAPIWLEDAAESSGEHWHQSGKMALTFSRASASVVDG